ncbi:MAG TPA: hypothetical protein VFB58_02815 [Chloroflexota bacterium]|nr:hypothetical protein [Chloroflexota bacterium]
MVPAAYLVYFAASVGASAALTGLLFVAVSLSPARIVGPESTVAQRARAGSAFMALLDAFFVSFTALIPGVDLGNPALLTGVIAMINTLSLARRFWSEPRQHHELHGVTLLIGSFAIYLLQIWYALPLIFNPHAVRNVEALAYLLIGTYALGLGRSWVLLGAQHEGLFTLFGIGGSAATPAEGPPDERTDEPAKP